MTSDEFYAKLFCIHSSSYTVAGLYVRVPGVFSLFMDFFYCLANAGQPIFYPRVSFCTMIFAIRLCILIFRVIFGTRAAVFRVTGRHKKAAAVK